MIVSQFPSRTNHTISKTKEMSWAELVDNLRKPKPSTVPKEDLPLWSPASYRDGYVKDENVEHVYALGFDVDEDPIPDDARIRRDLEAMGVQAVVHTSSSSTTDAPRWRLMIAVSRPITGAEYRRLWMAVASVKLSFPVGRQSKNPSRGWYAPRRGPDESYECFVTEGVPLDVDATLTWAPAWNDALGSGAVGDVDFLAPEQLPAHLVSWVPTIAAAMRDACPEPGHRHELSLRLAGALVSDALPFKVEHEAVPAFVYRVCAEAGFGTLAQKWTNAVHTVSKKRAGGTIAGLTSLRDEFPAVATALEPPPFDEFDDPVPDVEDDERRPASSPVESVDAGPKGLPIVWGHWNEPIDPPVYLLEGLIPEGKVVCMFAEGGSVKSWTAFSLCIAVADGVPWLGKYAVIQGKALYIDFEDGPYEMRRRRNMLADSPLDDVENLGYLYAKAKLLDPKTWRELGALGLRVIVIDSLSAATPTDVDENSKEAVEVLRLAGLFTEAMAANGTPCTVVFIHHANKSGGMRGFSGLRDQCDVVFRFEAVSEHDDGTKRMRMVCDKPGPQRKPTPVNVELSDDGLTTFDDEGFSASTQDNDEDGIQARILLTLETEAISSKKKLHKRVGGNYKTFEIELGELMAKKKVVHVDDIYQLEDHQRRLDRVLVLLKQDGLFRSHAELAKAARVKTEFVESMARQGLIFGSAEGRLMVVKK